AEYQLRGLARIVPELSRAHPIEATGPEECRFLLRNSLRTMYFAVQNYAPSYEEWLESQDMVQGYRDYRRQLQLLSWQMPAEPLVLKAPAHLWYLDSLLAVFPDALVIHTHRDPLKIVPSYASLMSMLRSIGSDAVDPHRIGDESLRLLARGSERAVA